MVDINRVYEALNLLNNSNKADCEAASQFLAEFQKSVYAWNIADQILKEARSPTVCIFAAQTMRRKMARDFQQLPADSYLSLRESLVNHLW
jgi:transportin-3